MCNKLPKLCTARYTIRNVRYKNIAVLLKDDNMEDVVARAFGQNEESIGDEVCCIFISNASPESRLTTSPSGMLSCSITEDIS